eukprot:2394312-Amphidinium_carterae.1
MAVERICTALHCKKVSPGGMCGRWLDGSSKPCFYSLPHAARGETAECLAKSQHSWREDPV